MDKFYDWFYFVAAIGVLLAIVSPFISLAEYLGTFSSLGAGIFLGDYIFTLITKERKLPWKKQEN